MATGRAAASKLLRALGERSRTSSGQGTASRGWILRRQEEGLGPILDTSSSSSSSSRSYLEPQGVFEARGRTTMPFNICMERAHFFRSHPHRGLPFPSAVCSSSSVNSLLLDEDLLSGVVFPGSSRMPSVGRDLGVGRSAVSFSTNSSPDPAKSPGANQSVGQSDQEKADDKPKAGTEGLGSRIGKLIIGLDEVPLGALGLGLAGAIPFVCLTPGIASLLPLPEALSSIHVEAQAAYGAAILAFLGGPHWGLAMTDYGRVSTSNFSRQTITTVRYVWSVIPSLVAWPALLLSPVPKFALLIASFGVVLGVDAVFARMGLVPSWYMPLRVLLTGIAILSMTSSLIVSAAATVAHL